MRFLVDAQLPPALARWLKSKGHSANHVADIGLEAAPDSAIWDRAIAIEAVIVTKDEDFARRRSIASSGPAVVWLRVGNTGRRQLLNWFEPLLPSALAAIDQGETVVEIH